MLRSILRPTRLIGKDYCNRLVMSASAEGESIVVSNMPGN